MPYIGNPIYQSAFVTDQFSGDGTTTAFTMSVAPAGTTNVLVVVSGVVQDPSTYGVTGTTLNFSAAPPSGTGNISCRYLGVPVTGVTTTAYRTVTEFTATAGQTTFTPPSYTVGFINVYLNGVLLGSADYTATNGTTVVLATGAAAGNLVTVESFQISSVVNAIQNSAGSVSNTNLATGAVTPAKLSTGGPYWDTSSNFGIGTVTPTEKLHVVGSSIIGSGSSVAAFIQNTNPAGYATLQFSNDAAQLGYVWQNGSTQTNYGGGGSLNIYTNGSQNIAFGTNLVERMRISPSGYVTAPYQPAFSAEIYNGAGSSASSYTYWTWSTIQVNIGSNWNNSTGLFTCPVAGKYMVMLNFSLRNNYNTYSAAGILKNGTLMAHSWFPPGPDTGFAYSPNTVTTVLSCAANDTIAFGWHSSYGYPVGTDGNNGSIVFLG
jgi:hypothetical protein